MKLKDLHPRFLNAGGDGVYQSDGTPAPERFGVGIIFDCPCGCSVPCFVPFNPPLDGGPPTDRKAWDRTGSTFDDLTLNPSILRSTRNGGCGWHGFIRNGEIITC